jgi:hypothetical protein
MSKRSLCGASFVTRARMAEGAGLAVLPGSRSALDGGSIAFEAKRYEDAVPKTKSIPSFSRSPRTGDTLIRAFYGQIDEKQRNFSVMFRVSTHKCA